MAGRTSRVQQLEREAAVQPVICEVGGCKNPGRRVGNRVLCLVCESLERSKSSKAFCEAKGLRTVDEMRGYCRDMARKFRHRQLDFDTWTKNMTQGTVDIIERTDGQESKSLERLRGAGVIDGRNKLIPLEARQTAADAYAAERARLICQVQEELARREPGADEEEGAPA